MNCESILQAKPTARKSDVYLPGERLKTFRCAPTQGSPQTTLQGVRDFPNDLTVNLLRGLQR